MISDPYHGLVGVVTCKPISQQRATQPTNQLVPWCGVAQVSPGTCVHIAAGQKHRVKNTGDEEMVLLYFGIAVEPSLEGGGAGGDVGRGGGKTTTKGGSALHAIGDDK